MLKYVLTFVFLAVLWAVVWWFEFPWWIAISVTAATALVFITLAVVRAIRARRASREIERALKAQAEKQANAARPDLEADIRALQGEFNRAIGALKSSRLGAKGASSALYALPWYVIVGPPGVGKSTALRNSGLRFPFTSSRGGASVRGVGGTRNCEWWMTSDAVILDTAGRYTTEDSDRDEWFAFLDLLRRYRSRRPINGVIAALSIADILEAHPDEVANLAREIRARIDELQDRLGVVVPVYLVFTKCDLLPGFVEMFADLGDRDRHQIWGFTLPVHDQHDLSGKFLECYDELTGVLEKRVLRRIAEERRAEGREKLYELPQYIAALRDPMSRFVYEVMQENIYHETPVLRGVYLSSGTQEGHPVNRIMDAISEGFGIRPTIAKTAGPTVEAKSYFLGDLFAKVIFPDHRLTRPNRVRTRRRNIVASVAGAVLLTFAAGLMLLPLRSFRDNRQLIRDAGTAVAYVEQHLDEDTIDAIPLERIDPLRATVTRLAEYQESGPPWKMRMGLYQGAAIFPRLRDVYAATIRKELLLPVIEQELAELQRLVVRYSLSNDAVTPEEYAASFERLRIYMMCSRPREAGEPPLDADEQAWLAAHISALWERPLKVSGDPATMASMEAIATAYIAMLASEPALSFERDTKLVERVQRILKRSDRSKSVASALIDAVDGPSLHLRDMVAVSSIRNQDRIIRPAFTRQGYEEQIKPRLEGNMDSLLDEQWVLGRLGDDGDRLRSEEIEAIRTEYFRQYILEWRTFIDSIYIDAPDDYVDALGLLTDLSRREPFKDLFTHIAYHTQLVDLNVEPDGGGEGVLLKEAGRIGIRRASTRLGLGRMGINPRLAGMAAKSAANRVLSGDPNAALKLTDADVTYAFLGLVEFGARKAPPPQADPSAPPPPPEEVPIDEYQEQLAFVRDALQERIDDPASAEKLMERLKAARSKVKSLLSAQSDTGWQPTFEKLLWPPIDLVWSLAGKGVADDLTGKWCNDIVANFERNAAKRYPFNPTGYDMALSDFSGFFHPETGELWKFYDAVLKSDIVLRGTQFELGATGVGSTKKYRGSVVSFLNAAYEISTSIFPGASENPLAEFDVLIQGAPGIKEIVLTIDGETIRYRNGPEVWNSIVWPGEGTKGARIEAKGVGIHAELEREGDWGLFRVLEEGKVQTSPDQRVFTVQWDFREENAGLIQMKFRPKRGDTPFFGIGGRRRFMTIFRSKQLLVPRSIIAGGPSCAETPSD